MNKTFPQEMGNELGGKSFCLVFETNPKIIEFVTSSWTDNCTGLFLEFQNYVNERLRVPCEKDLHVSRCQTYANENANLPKYMMKYLKWPPEMPHN